MIFSAATGLAVLVLFIIVVNALVVNTKTAAKNIFFMIWVILSYGVLLLLVKYRLRYSLVGSRQCVPNVGQLAYHSGGCFKVFQAQFVAWWRHSWENYDDGG